MTTINVRDYEGCFVLNFGTSGHKVNAYTLATALVGVADAARAANSVINPGYEIEIFVEALGEGSFKATIRTLYRGAGNLFSRGDLKTIALGVVASYIFQTAFTSDPTVVVNVTSDEVVIDHGSNKVIIPREIHDAMQQARESSGFERGIEATMQALEEDESISSMGIETESSEETVPIARQQFANFVRELNSPAEASAEFETEVELQVLRAILERTRRRWEFVWNGHLIAAPVVDDQFYDDFFAHRITLGPGDKLRAIMKVRQRRDPDTGVLINHSYEVVRVLEHIEQPRQMRIEERKAGAAKANKSFHLTLAPVTNRACARSEPDVSAGEVQR